MQPNLNNLLAYFTTEAKNFSGHFGLAAQRLDHNIDDQGDSEGADRDKTDEAILFQADDIFPTASVIKLAALAEYFAQVEAGQLQPEQELILRASDQVGGSGVLQDLQPGLRLRLQDLATLSITVSDNTAANLLIKQVGGLERINARLQALGMTKTHLGRPFIFKSKADNTGTPADFLHLLVMLARHELISPASSRQMLDIMHRQQYMDYIPRYLPYHPFAVVYGRPQTLTIANKVGMLPGTINDAAIITTPTCRYALVIFSRDCQDSRPDADNEGALLVARLSKQIYHYYID